MAMRTAAFIFLMAIFILGYAMTVSQIGKSRKPIDAGTAVAALFVQGTFVALIWYLWAT
jgi:hypothetical protein